MSDAGYFSRVFVGVAGILAAGIASAGGIYKWQDQKGTTHYSERPPAVELSSVEVLDVEPAGTVTPAPESYRSALELANSLQAGRLEREKLRLERARLAQEERRARLDADRYYGTAQTRYYYGGYIPYRTHPGRPHHGKPHPRPPPAQHPGSYPEVSVPKRVYPGR
jgi:hypothetical protein